MKVLMFPGQGSQKTGMGENHYQENDLFRSLVDEADQLLGYSLSDLMFNGPSDRLVQTRYTQPAIFLQDRKSTRLNSSHVAISYAVFGLKNKNRHVNCRVWSVGKACAV